jgi:hypothetical protein
MRVVLFFPLSFFSCDDYVQAATPSQGNHDSIDSALVSQLHVTHPTDW